jgi:hypothetical protein
VEGLSCTTSFTAVAGIDYPDYTREPCTYGYSIGCALVEALDNFIAERRIEPQIAIELLKHFDRIVAEVLAEKVKSRLSFKVFSEF